nr:MAG TPA: hypothetical protein [Caudoviricetes sp.]
MQTLFQDTQGQPLPPPHLARFAYRRSENVRVLGFFRPQKR